MSEILDEFPALVDMIQAGGYLDWISPAAGLAGEFSGVTAAIMVPAGCGYTGTGGGLVSRQ